MRREAAPEEALAQVRLSATAPTLVESTAAVAQLLAAWRAAQRLARRSPAE